MPASREVAISCTRNLVRRDANVRDSVGDRAITVRLRPAVRALSGSSTGALIADLDRRNGDSQ